MLLAANLVSINLVNGEKAALNPGLAYYAAKVHESLLPLMGTAILLHIAGALKHHVIDKNNTLKRMLGFKN